MGNDQDHPTYSGLHLGLGLSLTTDETTMVDDHLSLLNPTPMKPYFSSFITQAEPYLTLGLSSTESYPNQHVAKNKIDGNYKACGDDLVDLSASAHSVASSFSGGRLMKRERDLSCEEVETEATERVSSRVSDEDEDATNARKKLRLTKQQSMLLEESFKQHSTLNPKQKQALARQLHLRPRQVEVWFQNRRARTKLKQTEVDCEFLKKCCETLTEENKRLKKELQTLKQAQPMYMAMPAATLSMCPSCERIVGDGGSKKSPFSMAPKPHFYNPFTNYSAAC
ncbi:hypothetical protein Lal_00007574 [Lupinus albus]|uniref:Putative transcription factor homeobox-WOX family n=1 Tax=Lupinus albus TaxID=3870 RepID=A0A6A4PAU1_LUPAL|nr:putative transcription factor homeobox-WOX family [Lupinus albus]KAF1874958.1 hypothetical protein Lal_00007574 [Lupinus albus]